MIHKSLEVYTELKHDKLSPGSSDPFSPVPTQNGQLNYPHKSGGCEGCLKSTKMFLSPQFCFKDQN
jgi:hypothetical protein